MKTYTKEELNKIIADHQLWLNNEGGARADLRSANLSYADLRSANLRSANLRSANLRSANLSYANLRSANLRSANLSYADLRSANLRSANLSSANLSSADLSSADLSSANLSSANLSSANLRSADLDDLYLLGCTGNMRELKSIFLDTYQITYTSEHMQIGCEKHLIKDWWKFDDNKINNMDRGALDWWKTYKALIKKAIKISPATPVIKDEKE